MSLTSKDKIPLSLLKQLPKAELHTHLDGCIRTKTLMDIAQKHGKVQFPGLAPGEIPSEQELQDILLPPGGAASLAEFLRAYEYSLPVLQTPEAMQRVFRETAEDYMADGVTYVEIRFCPALHTSSGHNSEKILRAVIEESKKVSEESNNGAALPITRVIVCALRNAPVSESIEMAELAVKIAKEEESLPEEDRQLVGFDLAGDEAAFATSLFTEAFDYVHKNSSLGITVHSGEAAGWESVEQAIDLARATRLGHGVRLAESPQLVKRLELNVDHPTTIEVCVTSNLLTKTINCLEEHPVRQFYDAGPGLRIVPCTDGIAMIGTTVSEQYDILQCSFGFTPQELVSILEDSFKAAFCPPTVKESLLKAATSKYQTLLSSHGFVQ